MYCLEVNLIYCDIHRTENYVVRDGVIGVVEQIPDGAEENLSGDRVREHAS